MKRCICDTSFEVDGRIIRRTPLHLPDRYAMTRIPRISSSNQSWERRKEPQLWKHRVPHIDRRPASLAGYGADATAVRDCTSRPM